MGQYQSFNDSNGVSDSSAKLEALRLPNDMSNKSFLDIGCNEGFFCIEAKRRGATRIIGIDSSPSVIKKAHKRDARIDFRVQTWDHLPAGPFDYILLASALHYEPNPLDLIKRIHNELADDGMFLLEGGISNEKGKRWVNVQRSIDARRFPTFDLLPDLLHDFAYRVYDSVRQEGDPIRRYVVHCRKRKPVVLLVRGKAKEGKSSLAREFAEIGAPTLATDRLLGDLVRAKYAPVGPALETLRKRWDGSRIDHVWNSMIADGFMKDLIDLICDQVPVEVRILILEGVLLYDDEANSQFVERLSRRGFVVWNVSRADH